MMRKAAVPCGVLQERPPGFPGNGGSSSGPKQKPPPKQSLPGEPPTKAPRVIAAAALQPPDTSPAAPLAAPVNAGIDVVAPPSGQPVLRPASHSKLLAELMSRQKHSPFVNKRWELFCEHHGVRIKDPQRHEESFLRDFLDLVNREQAASQPRDQGVHSASPGRRADLHGRSASAAAADADADTDPDVIVVSDSSNLMQSIFNARDKADLEQWVESPSIGAVVPYTCIVPCKTPIEGQLAARAEEAGIIDASSEFTRRSLLEICRTAGTPIGLVIDLVSTKKYYNGFDQSDGVEYVKIPVPAKVLPPVEIIEAVLDAIDEFMGRRPSPDLHVALHCTHGVNRTGFFVGAYLLLRTEKGAELGHRGVIDTFNAARGCEMDKALLLDALREMASSGLQSFV